jgi:hypothetical protein
LPYLYLPAERLSVVIIIITLLTPSFLFLAGLERKELMRGFFILMLAINIIISIPMIQTEIKFSHNFDEIGTIGKYIQNNIDEAAVIFWDSSVINDKFKDNIAFELIDYWITNDLRSVNLKDIALSGDYSKIQDGDYIITNLPGSTKPVYTFPKGVSLYHL